jgi:prophage antirepressor-like protein
MELTVFNYNKNRVRTVTINNEPWFVLKDVCEILGIGNSRMVAERLDDDEKSNVSQTDIKNCDFDIPNRGFTIINESGLYKVILRSDKPEADRLMRFVTHEVLPSIRKTGSYIRTPQTYIQALEALLETEREKERLALENDNLQIELDESKKYYTIKRVAKMNGISWKLFSWRKLKYVSQAMECEVKKVFDANFESVNAYHLDVWRHEYPELRYA